MSAMLYAFGLGFFAVLGVLLGVMLARVVIRKGAVVDEAQRALNNRVEDRLDKYTAHTARIANALESIERSLAEGGRK